MAQTSLLADHILLKKEIVIKLCNGKSESKSNRVGLSSYKIHSMCAIPVISFKKISFTVLFVL